MIEITRNYNAIYTSGALSGGVKITKKRYTVVYDGAEYYVSPKEYNGCVWLGAIILDSRWLGDAPFSVSYIGDIGDSVSGLFIQHRAAGSHVIEIYEADGAASSLFPAEPVDDADTAEPTAAKNAEKINELLESLRDAGIIASE